MTKKIRFLVRSQSTKLLPSLEIHGYIASSQDDHPSREKKGKKRSRRHSSSHVNIQLSTTSLKAVAGCSNGQYLESTIPSFDEKLYMSHFPSIYFKNFHIIYKI